MEAEAAELCGGACCARHHVSVPWAGCPFGCCENSPLSPTFSPALSSGARGVHWPRAPAGGRGSFLSTTERVGLPPPASVSSLGAFTILRQLRRPHGFTPSFISLVCVNHNELPQTGPQLIAICLHSGGWKAKMEMPARGGGAVISEATAHSQMLSLRRVLTGRARRGGVLYLFSQGQESHREAPPS